MIRILLADDHHLFRNGLRRILEGQSDFEIVAEASTGLEAIDLAKLHRPDVAVVDIGMKELNGIEATAQIIRQSPETGVLILSMYSDERYVMRAVKAGARGYLLKDTLEEGLIGPFSACRPAKRISVLPSPSCCRTRMAGVSTKTVRGSVRFAYGSRASAVPPAGRGKIQQGNRRSAGAQSSHSRNPPHTYHG